MNYLSVNAMEHFLNSFMIKLTIRSCDASALCPSLRGRCQVGRICNVRRYDLHLEKPYTMILHGKEIK